VSEDRGETRRGADHVPDAVVAHARHALSFRRPDEELIPLVSDSPGDGGQDSVDDDYELQFAHPRIWVSVAISGGGPLAVLRTTVARADPDHGGPDGTRFRVSLECANTDHSQEVIAVIPEMERRASDADAVFCLPHGVVRLRIGDPSGAGASETAYHTDWFIV